MKSPKPKECQKRKISYQFWEKMSEESFAGSFQASSAANLTPPKDQNESLINNLYLKNNLAQIELPHKKLQIFE
jgi:hypothetical protein